MKIQNNFSRMKKNTIKEALHKLCNKYMKGF